MDLSEAELPPAGREAKIIEALALALDIAIILYDRDDKVIAVSPRFQRFTNIPSEMLVAGARLRDLLGASFDAGASSFGSVDGKTKPISRDDWIAEQIATHWRERHECVERLADGRWVRLCKRRMPDGILVSTIEDVSEQMRRNEELAASRQQAELAQHILDNLANPVVVKDSSLRYVAVNEAFCRIPGLRPKHLIGHTARLLVSPEIAAEFEAIERRVLDTGEPYEAPQDVVRGDGSIMRAVTRIHRSGKPGNYYITVSFDDMSEYVQQQQRVAGVQTRSKLPPPEVSARGAGPERILVLESNQSNGAHRVAELKAAGSDAFAIPHLSDAVAFLAEADKMQIRIDRIELCDALASELASDHEMLRHPVLAKALRIWNETAFVNQATPSGPDEAKVLQPLPQSKTETQPESVVREPEPAPAVVNCAVPQEPGPGTEGSLAPIEAPDRLRVLVAEDNHVNQIVFEQILEGIKADYRIVCNGKEALVAWQGCPPDLILMDVSMPVMNGLQATMAIRKAERDEPGDKLHTPIIAVTAHAMDGDKQRCLDAGMDDYLSKPVSPDKLEEIIAKWVKNPKAESAVNSMCLG